MNGIIGTVTGTVKTASVRGKSNRRKGLTAERDLCRWLRSNGFPHAERAVRTGFNGGGRKGADPGDITGTPLILWSVKDCAVEQIGKWFDELDDMSDNAAEYTTVRLIVHKRRGHADPGKWHCWMSLACLVDLVGDAADSRELRVFFDSGAPVRLALADVVPLLRSAGYGEPLEAAS